MMYTLYLPLAGRYIHLVAQITDLVDPAVTGGINLDDIQMGLGLVIWQPLISCAKMRAIEVLPTPRGPVNR